MGPFGGVRCWIRSVGPAIGSISWWSPSYESPFWAIVAAGGAVPAPHAWWTAGYLAPVGTFGGGGSDRPAPWAACWEGAITGEMPANRELRRRRSCYRLDAWRLD
jgi:hypothetical protein